MVGLAGAEKCLESIYRLFPSEVYTLVHNAQTAQRLGIPERRVHDSYIARLPWAERSYRSYLALYPTAVEAFDLSDRELIISSSHAVAKGVITHADQLHICYCYTPMRYAWDLYHQYLRQSGLQTGVKGMIAKAVLHYLRLWDLSSAQRVTHFVAISHYIARRIEHVYRRPSTVIHPPVDIDRFPLSTAGRDDFYLAASRFVPYKRMDLIVDAFARMPDKRLVVIGQGPDEPMLRARAPRNVQFMGYQSDEVLIDRMQRARGFVFAAEEDFGIIPVEAQACGTPVIAFGRGGSRETVRDGLSGVFFEEQTVASLVDAVRRFEVTPLAPPGEIRRQSLRFSRERFEREFSSFVDARLEEFRSARQGVKPEGTAGAC
jgi:glycosyltransferase involved in cell wall biosynthesis